MPGYLNSVFLSGTGFVGMAMNLMKLACIVAYDGMKNSVTLGFVTYISIGLIFYVISIILHLKFMKYEDELDGTKRKITVTAIDFNDLSSPISPTKSRKKIEKVEEKEAINVKTAIKVFKKNSRFVTLLFITYVQSLMMFPGIALEKPMSYSPSLENFLIVFGFNAFDTIG
eukprot:CAMPEP_0114602676 /NCGR_PEP_ID=MMETSP0125-20121206/25252_1 /TAXON_ID=485358 ORGANISM="Aristerostoma sp., Strain ATCC 50986" /NCGR_SAMPLE_ID=MMETSP0125 /ASSEMBLY_ACC=CAM_ASM_000245 /LENGTH=170 /DNA_ID=CAMNT_0001813057 /DNA_START=419 /DNA_END=927 /DNA_ORIENTATION=-